MPRGVKDKTTYSCTQCGIEFSNPKRALKPHKHYFCSNDCWQTYCRSKRQTSVCQQCGKEYEHNKKNRAGLFCSRECAFEYKRTKKSKQTSWIRKCKTCEKIFLIKGHTAKYCSDECRRLGINNAARKRATYNSRDLRKERYIPREKACKNCGNKFWTEFKGLRDFCSDDCRTRFTRERSQQRKHHRLDGIIIDNDITLTKLSARDGGTCKLCGTPVDWNDYKIDSAGSWIAGARYPSIDHIYPICMGGKHEWNNVQLAHFLCNSLKGAGAG